MIRHYFSYFIIGFFFLFNVVSAQTIKKGTESNNGIISHNTTKPILTCKILKKYKYKHLRKENLQGYNLLIKSNYTYSNASQLKNVLKANKKQIQTFINKVNIHSDTPITSKTLLGDQYPKAFFFRKPDKVSNPYNQWVKEYERLSGIFIKAMAEELGDREQDKILNYANRFALEHPRQLTILHFNGRSRDPNWEGISKYSAGHWIYNKGCYLEEDLSVSDAYIQVSDDSVFKTGFGLNGAKKNDDIVLVPIDDEGNKLWEQAEQVTLLSKEKGRIKVLRAQYETKARDFKKGKTYIAPHASGGPWGDVENNNLLWYYNLSSVCPVDENGKQCADVLAEDIGSWFAKDGMAFAFDGIQFDIASWKANKKSQGRRFVDIDTNGEIDKGFINGDNVFGMGTYNFYTLLRKALGPNKLIVGDGGVDYGMRAVGVASGMEAEGLCDWGDAYKEYAKPLNFFSYWKRYAITPSLSYVTNKIKKGTAKEKKDIERMVVATAQCLEIGFNTFVNTKSERPYRIGILDELVKGDENKPYWLGKPVGQIIDLSEQTELSKSLNLNDTEIETIGCSYKIEDDKLIISSKTNKAEKSMRLILKNVPLGTGDFHLKFSAKTAAPISGFNALVPRQITVSTDAIQDVERTASSVMNYINSLEALPCSFYFRNVSASNGDLEIEIEGGGEVAIENIRLVNGQLALARAFENGVVLVNPSLEPFTFHLDELFPDSKFKRLKASAHQDKKVNNGNDVGKTVSVSGLNGLFLIKK
ncbi:hypothetical protein [uncultured Algibacter sp.]|uniref:hypothetical protein n=1 Tax=uncultured Algibacter sp. TaxID=298659 RepID=UPI002629204A|nr:hypothetical protein [uncultured Algibacter sp.]